MRICKIVDFAVLADHRIKLKECGKKDKYLDLAKELKKLWNMRVTIVPIVIGAFGTVTKGLLKGLEDLEVGGRVETIQHYWQRPEYGEESWRLEETCCHSNSSQKPSANTDVKNFQRLNNNNNNNNNNNPENKNGKKNDSMDISSDKQTNKKRTCRIVDFAFRQTTE